MSFGLVKNFFFFLKTHFQFNNDEAAFMAGNGIDNSDQKASILGSMSIAQHVHLMAKYYLVCAYIFKGHFNNT